MKNQVMHRGGNSVSGPRLVVGTAQFGGRYGIANAVGAPGEEALQEMASLCQAGGVREFDTAPAYGVSESVLGRFFDDPGLFEFISKLPFFEVTSTEADVIAKAEASLAKSMVQLNRNSLNTIMLHRGGDLNAPWGKALWNRLREWKQHGLVSNIGISIYTLDELPTWIFSQAIDVIQVPLNFLDHRVAEHAHFPLLQKTGVRFHARSVFLQGLVFMEPGELAPHFDPVKPILRRFHQYCQDHGLDPSQVALDYVRNQHWVEAVVLGMETPEQVEENISIFATPPLPVPDVWRCDDTNILNPFAWPPAHV